MAYNVLKGKVAGSVDQHGDQLIDGVKVFKNTVSAATFYDTDAQSPCATENNVALKKISKEVEGGILIYKANKVASTDRHLRFGEDGIFRTHVAVIGNVTGSGGGLTDLRASRLIGKVSARSIDFGAGLDSHGSSLKVKPAAGIKVTTEGVSLNLFSLGGIDCENGKVTLNHRNTPKITENGQNISDDDLLLLHDADRREVRHTTFKNLYDNYIKFKTPHPQGSRYSLQYRGKNTFEASAALVFDPRESKLKVDGVVDAHMAVVSRALYNGGAAYRGIKTVSAPEYGFTPYDNTVLFDASNNPIVAILPPADGNEGRVITIKRICADDARYKIKPTHKLVIRAEHQLIDFNKEIVIQGNYSTRTLQSDGKKWWIINRSGS